LKLTIQKMTSVNNTSMHVRGQQTVQTSS